MFREPLEQDVDKRHYLTHFDVDAEIEFIVAI